MSGAPRELTVWSLGRVEYADGLELQRLTQEARARDQVTDTLLLLEHPPVVTLGRAAKRENVTASDEALRAAGAEVFETDRGGDVTYHGPGQVVGYPIFFLEPGRQDVRAYVRAVEECLIRSLAHYGLTAFREPRWPGVWVHRRKDGALAKIAAIGVHLSRWYTRHGFALNVHTDLSHFGWIVPCGITEAGVTSMAEELGSAPPMREVEAVLARAFGDVFGANVQWAKPALETVAVAVVRRGGDPRVLLLQRNHERGGYWQLVTGKVNAGESSPAAAVRELSEETGRALAVTSLDYTHCFALGEAVPARVTQEQGFVAEWPDAQPPRLDPREHQAFRWATPEEAIEALPFPGLKRTLRLALSRGPAFGRSQ